MNREVLALKLLEFCQNILAEDVSLSSPTEFGFIQEEKSVLLQVVNNLTIYK